MAIFPRKKMYGKALILGCGPAGLFAAHAFEQAGWSITIVSKFSKGRPSGCQYLHQPIPGLTEERTEVDYVLHGDATEYAKKVYGDPLLAGCVSAVTLQGRHPAWNLRRAYDCAWGRLHRFVRHADLPNQDAVANLIAIMKPDITVSSIPAPLLCGCGHTFNSKKVWVAGDDPTSGRLIPFAAMPDTVVCNGDPNVGWYRKANVFGHTTIEWPIGNKPPVSYVSAIEKPVSNNCNCLPGVIRVGRYGRWQKGALAHEAYRDVMEAIGGGKW
jgi:hypothetical protein